MQNCICKLKRSARGIGKGSPGSHHIQTSTIMATQTIIISKNPQTAIKAMKNRAFMCIAPINHKSKLVFNETMFAVDSAGASVSKLAKFARQNQLNDSTHTIYQVCPNGVVYEYSIDKN